MALRGYCLKDFIINLVYLTATCDLSAPQSPTKTFGDKLSACPLGVPILKDNEMKYVYSIFVIFLIHSISYTQENIIPTSPVCGWDSLKSRIIYPKLASRNGLEEEADVYLDVDSLGSIVDMKIHYRKMPNRKISVILELAIKDAIQSTRWLPEKYQGNARQSSIFFSIDFIVATVYGKSYHRHFVIEGDGQPIKMLINQQK